MPSATPTEPAALVRAFLAAMEARDLAKARTFLGDGFAMTFPGGVRMTTLEELVAFAAPRYRFVRKAYEGFEVVMKAPTGDAHCGFGQATPPRPSPLGEGRPAAQPTGRMGVVQNEATEFHSRHPDQPAEPYPARPPSVSGLRPEPPSPKGEGQEGGAVVYCFGTLSGEWPDGTPFSGIRFIDRFEIENGLLVRQDVWNDLAEIRSRAGAPSRDEGGGRDETPPRPSPLGEGGPAAQPTGRMGVVQDEATAFRSRHPDEAAEPYPARPPSVSGLRPEPPSPKGEGQEGGAVVYCFGTLSGEWPDGTPFSGIRFIDRFEIEAGLLVRQDVWNDLAEIRSRAGAPSRDQGGDEQNTPPCPFPLGEGGPAAQPTGRMGVVQEALERHILHDPHPRPLPQGGGETVELVIGGGDSSAEVAARHAKAPPHEGPRA